ncbi:hypothetical protein FB107DRAFT_280521 [Schizophyllum commune]
MPSPFYASLSSLLVEEYPDPLPTFLSGTRTSISLVISLDQPFGFQLVLFDSFACSRIFLSCGRAVSEFRRFGSAGILYRAATYEYYAPDAVDDARYPAYDARYLTCDVANSDDVAADTYDVAADAYDARDPTDAADDARTT